MRVHVDHALPGPHLRTVMQMNVSPLPIPGDGTDQ
jgi:hypothetical protein